MGNVQRALGRRVRSLRVGLKLSQEQLAEDSDLHWTHVSGIERGVYDVKLSTLTRVAKGLGVSLADLLAGVGDPQRSRRSPK